MLPVNIQKCNRVLVLCGETYAGRLWCIWELYCIFAFATSQTEAVSRVQLQAVSTSGDDIDVPSKLAHFSITNSHCYDPNEEKRILSVIKRGGQARFEGLIRSVGCAFGGEQKQHKTTSKQIGQLPSLKRMSSNRVKPAVATPHII